LGRLGTELNHQLSSRPV